MSRFLIYRSSAGSGKTFRLAGKYLELIIRKPSDYRRILAVTFTNKAAAEMSERILSELVCLSGDPQNSSYLSVLINTTGFKSDIIQKNARLALSLMLYDYGHVAIGTIDSFFQQVLRAFARESGLSTGYTLELNSENAMDEVVRDLIQESASRKEWMNWLSEWVEQKMDEGKSWIALQRDLNRMGQEFIKEQVWSDQTDSAISGVDIRTIRKLIRQCHSVISDFNREIEQYRNQINNLLSRLNLKPDEFKSKSRSPLVRILRREVPEVSLINTLRGWCADRDKWVAASASQELKSKVYKAMESGLGQLLNNLTDFYTRESPLFFAARMILEHVHALGLMSGMMELLNRNNEQQNRFLIQLTNLFLRKIISDNPTPFIFEKSGNYYHHFLIDEFQDTSDIQWKNLLPLIENSLSEEGTSMVVGDVKQSIYRWRNSNWRLLGMEVSRDLQNFGISVVPLTRNFRSRQVLIDFNNLIFSKLPGVISDNLELGNYSDWMIQAYKEAVQSSGTQKKGGYVQLKSYEEDQLPKLIEELQLEQGYQPADILFLVRKNKESRIISEAFAAYLNHNPAKKNVSYQLASADTYELGSSPAVRMVILAVNLLAAPDESYYYTLLHWQWCLWKHPEKNPAPGESFELADELIHSSGEIVTRDLTGIVAYIISLLGIDSDARFQGHLFFLYDQVRILQERGTGQIHDLIYWWDTRGQHMTVPMEITPGAIQMMTIHKAKGLQFPVVIIPFLNWDVGSAPKDHFIWVDTRSSPFNMISKVPLRFKQLLGETIFHDAYLREKIELAIDQLNLLYVACTRAQEALYLFTPNPEERRKHNISKYLFETLRNELGDKDEYRFGQPSRTSDEVHADPAKEIVVNRFYLPHEKRLPSLPKQPDTPEIETGLLVHKLLSELEHPRDIDRELEKLAAVEGLSMATYKWIIQRIRKVFDNDIVNDWFTGEWEVFTERSILLPGGDIRRPDRVMVHGTKAVVVDYKTGQPELKHNKQLKDYMTAISGMGYEDVKGYLLYLHEIKLVEVI